MNRELMPGKKGRTRKYIRLGRWGLYVVVLMISFFFDQWDEMLTRECDRPSLAARMWYQRICTIGHRKPRPHSVRLVVISPETVPAVSNKCEGREFMAVLLRRLAASSPSLIVIDIDYSSQFCAESSTDRQASEDLKQAVEDVSKTVPIVIGQWSDTEQELEDRREKDLLRLLKEAGIRMKANEMVLSSNLVAADGSSVKYGLLRMDCDNRRIPLFWSGYERKEASFVKRERVPSLALTAALVNDPETATQLAELWSKNKHPFTSFLPESAFKPISSASLICGSIGDNFRNCPAQDNRELGLRGKVLIVGHLVGDDHENVLGKKIPGVVLQANYLESLLDDRYFRSLNFVVEIALTIVCFVIVELIFRFSASPLFGLLYSAAFVILLWGICYIVVLALGYFIARWIPTSVAVIASFTSSLKHWL